MHAKTWQVGLLCAALCPALGAGVVLGRGGKAVVEIRLAAAATLAERTAAEELSSYLGRVIGDRPAIVDEGAVEDGAGVYVGPTAVARANGADEAMLGEEEWVIRTVPEGLILAGGRPRGTFYAVVRFLEDEVGVRWWNPWEEHVPSAPDLAVGELDRRGRPVLAYRDIYMLYGNDGGRFAARNRLNRDGDRRIEPRYGGCRDYGPPYHVHTFYRYIPPAEYFGTHPEYFSLIDGRRVAERHQLCLSNREVRDLFLEKLRRWIRESEARAEAAGGPPPRVYDISQNDWGGQCQCEACQAIVTREGSEAGLLLDFVNEIAARIAPEYPHVFLDTLAYQYTQKPPAHIRARDNVIVRLCDTRSNATFPITAEENREFREFLLAWGRVAENLRVWDYAVTYAPPQGLPYPSEDTYAADFRFYAENRVEGVFTELEFPVLADVRDLKVWLMMKLLEDPYRDPEALAREFTDGFYGAAGASVRAYRGLLRASQERRRAHIGMSPAASVFTFLDLDTVRRAQELFEGGFAALAGDPVRARRLRHARLSLDRATYVRGRDLLREWRAAGRDGPLPLDIEGAAERVQVAWTEQARMRLTGAALEKSLAQLEAERTRYAGIPLDIPLPERFRGRPAGTVHDFTADGTRNWQDIVKVVRDPEAESGFANVLRFPNDQPERHGVEKYRLPMPWGLYDQEAKKGIASASIRAEDVPGPGYHWYRMGTFEVPRSAYLYFFWSWIIQQDLGSVVDPDRPEHRFEVWAHVKFSGPEFPHARPGEGNAIWVERIVLVDATP